MSRVGRSDDRELIEQLRRSLGGDEPANATFEATAPDAADEDSRAASPRVVAPAAMAIADQIMGLQAADVDPTRRSFLIEGPDGSSVFLTDEIVIGRQDGEGRLVIADGRVSRSHVRLVRDSGSVTASDLGSSNGTSVVRNGEAIPIGDEPVELHVGDRLETIDRLLLATVLESEGEPT